MTQEQIFATIGMILLPVVVTIVGCKGAVVLLDSSSRKRQIDRFLEQNIDIKNSFSLPILHHPFMMDRKPLKGGIDMTSVDPRPVSETLALAKNIYNDPDRTAAESAAGFRETARKIAIAQQAILSDALLFCFLAGGCCALGIALFPKVSFPSLKQGILAGLIVGGIIGQFRANLGLRSRVIRQENDLRELRNQRLDMACLIVTQDRWLDSRDPTG
ncbi:MAG: hypothetical protein OXF02_01865 [Simkaniaceae bacterium]|nr:hypothetical protein [Simkaniaceae bacterium]